jgi:hypothetical protein
MVTILSFSRRCTYDANSNKKIFLIDPLVSAGYLNAILIGFIVYISGLFLLKHLKSLLLTITGTSFHFVCSSLSLLF